MCWSTWLILSNPNRYLGKKNHVTEFCQITVKYEGQTPAQCRNKATVRKNEKTLTLHEPDHKKL